MNQNDKTLKDIKNLAKKFGAKVEDIKEFNAHTCSVEAPSGFVWSCSDIHEIVDTTNQPWKPDYNDVYNRMKYGITVCPYGDDCEWCHSENGN